MEHLHYFRGECKRAERVIMDNRVEVPQKIQKRYNMKDPLVPLLGYIFKGTARMLTKDHTPMFAKALVTTLKIENHLNAYDSHW